MAGPWERYQTQAAPAAMPPGPERIGTTQDGAPIVRKPDGSLAIEAAPLAPAAPGPWSRYQTQGAGQPPIAPGPADDSGVMGDVNAVVNRLGTQFTKGLTSLAGLPSAAVEGLQGLGDWATRQVMSEDQHARLMQRRQDAEARHGDRPTLSDTMTATLPSAAGMNRVIFDGLGVPEVSGQTTAGKILDVGLQAIPAGMMFSPSAAFPAFTGGIASEGSGQIAEAAGASPGMATAARIGGGIIGGLGGAAAQHGAKTLAQGARNVMGLDDANEVAAKIANRAIARDSTDAQRLAAELRRLGPDATIADAGGANIRGTVRGSIATPGPARQRAEDFLTGRRAGEGERVAEAINANVSGRQGFAATIDDIVAERAKRAAPLYEAAGIPRDPSQYAQAPRLAGREVKDLLAKSRDIQSAIAQAKGLPQYANLADDSIVLLDKAYKNLGGKAEAARRSGDLALHRDLAQQRDALKAAIVAERPEYGAALKAFADDSSLKAAIETGRKLFKGATDPAIIAKEYGRMGAEQRELFRQGVAEHLRDVASRTATGSPAAKVMGGTAMQNKLRIVLGDDYPEFARMAEREATFNRTMRDVASGSRTVPMAAEAADLGSQMGIAGDVIRGDLLRLAGRAIGAGAERVATGRREAVNQLLADMLLNPDSTAQARTFAALSQQQQARAIADALRRGSYLGGAAGPIPPALAQPGQ